MERRDFLKASLAALIPSLVSQDDAKTAQTTLGKCFDIKFKEPGLNHKIYIAAYDLGYIGEPAHYKAKRVKLNYNRLTITSPDATRELIRPCKMILVETIRGCKVDYIVMVDPKPIINCNTGMLFKDGRWF